MRMACAYVARHESAGERTAATQLNPFNKELHRPVDDFVPSWLDVFIDSPPVVASVVDDHDLKSSTQRIGFLLHVVRMLDGNGRVLVTLNH